MENNKGFTIVEVLVVIGIIAALTIIIFPAVNNIRAKNRDAERISDIATIQLGLSMYYNQNQGSYPATLDLSQLSPKYMPEAALVGPGGESYLYVPLARVAGGKCSYYHLGATLELPSAQVDIADQFNSTASGPAFQIVSGGYYWCDGYSGPGLATGTVKYNVHP